MIFQMLSTLQSTDEQVKKSGKHESYFWQRVENIAIKVASNHEMSPVWRNGLYDIFLETYKSRYQDNYGFFYWVTLHFMTPKTCD